MVVLQGAQPLEPVATRRRFASSPLGDAPLVFADAWSHGTPHSGSCAFAPDDMVRIISSGELGRVQRIKVRPHGYEVVVTVNGRRSEYGEDALEPVAGDPLDPEFWIESAPAAAKDIAFTLTWTSSPIR